MRLGPGQNLAVLKWPNSFLARKWTAFSVMIYKFYNAKIKFLCLGLISSNGACVYMKYEIMKMNATRNANKQKEMFLFRDLSFAVNFNI